MTAGWLVLTYKYVGEVRSLKVFLCVCVSLSFSISLYNLYFVYNLYNK